MEPVYLIIIALLAAVCVIFAGLYFRQRGVLNGRSRLEGAGSSPEGEETLKDTSLRDPITHLYNRSHLLRRLQESISKSDRTQERLGLILWDIDGFIDFNNKYGQKEGDIFLRKVADIIRKTLRSYDEAFRCGADEFCAVLNPADEKIADNVTRRVSEAVSQSLFRDAPEYANEKFSISAGVVYYPSEHRLAEALLYAAGEKLFRNKPQQAPQSK